MRTVHEPEPARGTNTNANEPTPPGKKSIKLKLTNGSSATAKQPLTPTDPSQAAPTHDEDGNPVIPSHPNDNIKYIPARHPITLQPGFMITYPPDIKFTAWESSIPADQLMRLLRRQLHWAMQENEELKAECASLEQKKKEEWQKTDLLWDGVFESEVAKGAMLGLLESVDARVREQMEEGVAPARERDWTGGEPAWRKIGQHSVAAVDVVPNGHDVIMRDAEDERNSPTPSPPPTGNSAGGGFDGDEDPYDNYLKGRMAEYEERERLRSLQNTPQKAQEAREADAAGALLGMSGGGT